MKEIEEFLTNEDIKFKKGIDGSILVVDEDYFFDYQMVCTFAEKTDGAKVVVYDNIEKGIINIKLRDTFYGSLVKARKNPYPKSDVFTVGDEKRFWNRFLADAMGSISKYNKDGILSRDLLFSAANAVKQEMYNDGRHVGLKCFKNRFQSFIQIAFDLHIGDYIFYKIEYDCAYDEDEEETYCFNENNVYLGIWGKELYLLGVYIPSKTTINKDGIVKTIPTQIKDFRTEIPLNLNINLDYVLDLEKAADGLSHVNWGKVHTSANFSRYCECGTLAELPLIGQKEITLGDFHYILDDRSYYYVISSVEFIDKPKETDDNGLFKYEYQRDGNGITIIDYNIYDDEQVFDSYGGTFQFAKIADAIPYIEGNDHIPVDKRKSIVEKLNKYSDYLREEGDKKCRADREASLKWIANCEERVKKLDEQ